MSADVLSTDEMGAIEEALESGRINGPKLTISELITLWNRFTREEVIAYHLGLDDYTNDLSVRVIIAEAGRRVSPDLRAKLDGLLSEADARFLAATVPIRDGMSLGGTVRVSLGPLPTIEYLPDLVDIWHARLPTNPVGELRNDLVESGFLDP